MKSSHQLSISLLCFSSFLLISVINGYDLNLDKGKDTILWKFKGQYLYTPKGEDLDGVFTSTRNQPILPSAVKDDDVYGIWFARHIPNRDNKLIISYMLKHALFKQGWIRFLANPTTSVVIRTNNDRELGRFWSGGINWCDVVINFGLQSMITLLVETPQPGDYFILDKIMLGVFSNASALEGRKLNPCLTSPSNSTSTAMNGIPDGVNVELMELRDKHPSKSITGNSTQTVIESKLHNETMGYVGIGERRNTRQSSPRDEESPAWNSNHATLTSDPIELVDIPMATEPSETVQTKIKPREDKRNGSGKVAENDRDVSRMTLKPPTKRIRINLTNPTNTTLMDNLDKLELPLSDGIIASASSSSSSFHSNNNKNLHSNNISGTGDLKCECTCRRS